MSTVVADIIAGIKDIITDELGATYKELPFTLDVAKNRFAGGTKGFAVWAGLVGQVDGVNKFITVDQTFEVVLTETFGSSQTGDSSQRTAGLALYSRMENIYVKVSSFKANVPSRVMIAQRLSMNPIEFIDSNVAVLRATFDIKYRSPKIQTTVSPITNLWTQNGSDILTEDAVPISLES